MLVGHWEECIFESFAQFELGYFMFLLSCSSFDILDTVWSNVLKSNVSLLIFCLGDLSIEIKYYKSPTIIILLLVSAFMSINICFMYIIK